MFTTIHINVAHRWSGELSGDPHQVIGMSNDQAAVRARQYIAKIRKDTGRKCGTVIKVPPPLYGIEIWNVY